MSETSRLEALDRSVRVALSRPSDGESNEAIVARAKAFDDFLADEASS
jgi:hypothetical protein